MSNGQSTPPLPKSSAAGTIGGILVFLLIVAGIIFAVNYFKPFLFIKCTPKTIDANSYANTYTKNITSKECKIIKECNTGYSLLKDDNKCVALGSACTVTNGSMGSAYKYIKDPVSNVISCVIDSSNCVTGYTFNTATKNCAVISAGPTAAEIAKAAADKVIADKAAAAAAAAANQDAIDSDRQAKERRDADTPT